MHSGWIKYLMETSNGFLRAIYFHNIMGSYWYVENIPRALDSIQSFYYTDIVEIERSEGMVGFVNFLV